MPLFSFKRAVMIITITKERVIFTWSKRKGPSLVYFKNGVTQKTWRPECKSPHPITLTYFTNGRASARWPEVTLYSDGSLLSSPRHNTDPSPTLELKPGDILIRKNIASLDSPILVKAVHEGGITISTARATYDHAQLKAISYFYRKI